MGTGSILLVEDDIDVRATVAELLEDEGYRVTTARNGAEALAYLRSGGELPRLILLDLLMPVMDGWQFRTEQKKDQQLAHIPVIVYSANTARAPIDAVSILTKPVQLEELLRTLERHMAAP